MIEADPLTIVTIARDTGQILVQAGPPIDLPAAVPDFVSSILDAIRNAVGGGGFGETISGLTPGGSPAANGGETASGVGAQLSQ